MVGINIFEFKKALFTKALDHFNRWEKYCVVLLLIGGQVLILPHRLSILEKAYNPFLIK